MRSFEEILESPTKRSPFANGTSFELWAYGWCYMCRNDVNNDCPILLAAFLNVTPTEWTETGMDDYDCSEFEPREELQ